MAKPKDCAHCQKPATIHLTQIIDGKITKLDFCEDCPHQKEVSDPEAFSLAQILAAHGSGGADAKLLNTACSHCGMTLNGFKKTGRLGCAHCYEQFHDVVMQMLPQMQSGSEHTGKRPAAMLERMAHERRLTQLQAELKEAIRAEAYEEAARLRDELRHWSKQAPAEAPVAPAAAPPAAAAATGDKRETPPAGKKRSTPRKAASGNTGDSARADKSGAAKDKPSSADTLPPADTPPPTDNSLPADNSPPADSARPGNSDRPAGSDRPSPADSDAAPPADDADNGDTPPPPPSSPSQ